MRITRNDGIIEIAIHRDGGAAKWEAKGGGIHDQLGQAFYEVGRDPENQIVIITGTGDEFLVDLDMADTPPMTAAYWHQIFKEGKDLLNNLLDIEVPVIGG